MTDAIWITIDDAERVTALDRSTCYRKIAEPAESGWVSRVAIGAAGETAGRSRTEVLLSSLPMAAQCAYWHERLAAPAAPATDRINLAEVCDSARTEALRRLDIVRGALEIKQTRDRVTERLACYAGQVQESARTIWRWCQSYGQRGFAGLIPKYGEKKGTFTAITPMLADFIRAEYCRDAQPSPTDVQRLVAAYCEQIRVKAPCVATINRFIEKEIPQAVQTAARLGLKAYRAQSEPKIRRHTDDLAPNDIWVGDHRQLDVFVKIEMLNPRLAGGRAVRYLRPWFTAWVDVKSRTCTGWHLDVIPNSHTIALAARHGILTYGVPGTWYMDRGKDYRSGYWAGAQIWSRNVGPDEELLSVLAQLGCDKMHARAYTPWAKPIEPWFGHTFPAWERTLPGWCGSDNKERPDKLRDEMAAGKLLTFDQLREELARHLAAYHQREHGDTGLTPAACWEGVTKRIPDARALDIILMRHKPAKIFNDGIRLFGLRYWHDALFAEQGRTLEIRYDPANIGELVVFKDRKFLCLAPADKSWSFKASEADMRELGRRKKLARQQVRAALDAHPLVMDDERAIAQAVGDIRRKKVVTLAAPVTVVEPSGAVMPMILGTERAAAAVAERRLKSVARPQPEPEPEPPSSDAMRFLIEG